MAHRVVWSYAAATDVESIATYISGDSPAYARSVVKEIVRATQILRNFPNSGRMVPEFQNPRVREVPAYSYRILYKIEEEQVLILAVVHGKRNLN